MKNILAAVLLTASQFASATISKGTYEEPTAYFLTGYEGAEECYQDGGDWYQEHCWFKSTNTIKIKSEGNGAKVEVVVSTFGSNGHACLFEEASTEITANSILSAIEVPVFSDGKWEHALCEVTVEKVGEKSLSASTNGNCQFFCGARASLNIEEATLVKDF